MGFTFGEIRTLVAPYVGRNGKCADAPETALFARAVMEYLLISGSAAGVRKVRLMASQGYLTLPPEVEVPLKVKIEGHVAEVWSKWCSFHSKIDDMARCDPAEALIIEDGTQSPLAYALPPGGSIVGVMAHCTEDEDASIIVQGKDTTGRPVYMPFDGQQLPGERLLLKKNNIRYGKVKFSEITGVVKPKTRGYVTLFAVNPSGVQQQFLADWAPSETRPMYKRYRLTDKSLPRIVQVSMLCRIRLKDTYDDEDVTIFDSTVAIKLAAQRLNAEDKNDLQTAGYKKGAVEDILEKEAGYKKISGRVVDVYAPLSGASIRNIR